MYDKRMPKTIKPRLTASIEKYNRIIPEYTRLTGKHLEKLPLTIIKDLMDGDNEPIIKDVKFTKELGLVVGRKLTVKEQRHEKLDQKFVDQQAKQDLHLFAKNVERIVGKNASYTEDMYEREELAKEYMERDKKALRLRFKYEIKELEANKLYASYKYGKDSLNSGDKKTKNKINDLIERRYRRAKYGMKFEGEDNARYYAVFCADPRSAKLAPNGSFKKVDSIRDKVTALIEEKDRINAQLVALYSHKLDAHEDASFVTKRDKNEEKAAKLAFLRCKSMANKLKKMDLPEGDKERLYALMNEYIDTTKAIESANLKLKGTKLSKNNELYEKQRRRELESKLRVLRHTILKKFGRAERRAAVRKEVYNGRLNSIFALIIIGVLGAIGYFYSAELMALLGEIFPMIFGA
jgi:hypothetical protein